MLMKLIIGRIYDGVQSKVVCATNVKHDINSINFLVISWHLHQDMTNTLHITWKQIKMEILVYFLTFCQAIHHIKA